MRATILVMLEDTDEKTALEVKKAVEKVVEKIPKAEVELSVRGK
jgi:hypothetical protein